MDKTQGSAGDSPRAVYDALDGKIGGHPGADNVAFATVRIATAEFPGGNDEHDALVDGGF